MKNNPIQNKFRQWYLAGFAIILAVPIMTLPPWFYPPDWGKAIVFRSALAILLFLFLWQFLYKKEGLSLPSIKNNKIIWSLGGLFIVFLLASIFSVDSNFSFWASPYRGGGFITFAFYFVLAILSFFLFKKEDWKKAWIFSISVGIFVSLIALIQFYSLLSSVFVSVPSGVGSTIGNPIFLGIYLLLLLFPTLAFAIKENNKNMKIFYGFSALLFLYVIFITGSRASYLGVIAGTIFFLLLYPKKLKSLKISIAVFLIAIASVVLFANTSPYLNQLSQKNRIFLIIENRLNIKKAFGDERYKAWQTAIQEIKDKPILGWGPENLDIGFNKNYDPKITPSPWWDRAHNIFLDIGAQAGVLGIIAYLTLFIALFWQLQKTKRKAEDENTKLLITGIMSALAGYLVANFFSFDSTPTYLVFFLIIGYSLYLTNFSQNTENTTKPIKGKKIIISVLFLILAIFLWQYNFWPFLINTNINKANSLADQKMCAQSLVLLDKQLPSHSFIDSYLIMEYITDIKKCATTSPGNDLAYAKRGVELLKEGLKIQPLYLRYWIFLGSFTTIIANSEQDQTAKDNLIKEANSYFDKAEALSPRHTETLLERAKTNIVAENYQKVKTDAEKCMKANPILGDCYWIRALSELYMKDSSQAEQDIKTAEKYNFAPDSYVALYQLVAVYNKTEQYDKLANAYERLVKRDPSIPQYHSSLAFAYLKIGKYKEARTQALIFLRFMPEAEDEVNSFLKLLPY